MGPSLQSWQPSLRGCLEPFGRLQEDHPQCCDSTRVSYIYSFSSTDGCNGSSHQHEVILCLAPQRIEYGMSRSAQPYLHVGCFNQLVDPGIFESLQLVSAECSSICQIASFQRWRRSAQDKFSQQGPETCSDRRCVNIRVVRPHG